MHRFWLTIATLASAPALGQVQVTEPWVRATVAHQSVSGAFMQIESARDLRLVAARSPVAGVTEIHQMTMEQGVMRMGPVAGVELPAGRKVELKPGGYHVMMMGLKRQLKVGETVPLTLVLEGQDHKRETVEINAVVRPLNTAAETRQGH
jgi:copper(I)-binding protein